jgi:hypothetical protein
MGKLNLNTRRLKVVMKRIMAVLIMLLFVAFNGSFDPAEGGSAWVLIAKGDTAYKKFDNKAALQFYKKALETNTKNYETA